MDNKIEFEVLGIAQVLNRNRLRVPSNQREYSWLGDVQVRDFLQDIANAIRGGQPYFLGTIVLTKGSGDFLEVADGQQRLATTMMILACIRDWFYKRQDTLRVQGIENEFLFKIDFKTGERLARLTMNVDDNEFFNNVVINTPGTRASIEPSRRSHKLISGAVNEIREFIKRLEVNLGDNISEGLKDWYNYLEQNASVVQLCVADAANAFILFETLNDRGLKTSQADLVKNYLFGKADERLPEAQNHWSSMKGAVESVGDDNDLTMEFLRLACCIMTGHTRERDVMERVESIARNKTEALTLLSFLDTLSKDYCAVLNPDNPKWNEYGPQIRKSIATINLLGVKQIRPLLLAIARYFPPADAVVAFRRMVAWSVRFMIIGARGGRLDEGYAKLAHMIHTRDVRSADGLKEESGDIIVGDAEFKEAFAFARVSTAKLARYYLRSLETTARDLAEPEFVPNEDIVINLEHIMPQSLENWPQTLPQDAETHFARLGNMALLQAGQNSNIGAQAFNVKKHAYANSTFLLTAQVAVMDNWTTKEIEDRQRGLAELAVRTWAL